MCGRYAQSAQMRDLIEQFEVTGVAPHEALPQNWNIAPTNEIYIIRSSAFNGGVTHSRFNNAVMGIDCSMAQR